MGIRRSHDVPQVSRGTFKVVRAENGLAGLTAKAIRLPKSGSEVQILLEVRWASDKVVWLRQFDREVLQTVHSFRNGRIEESMGWAAIVLRITVASASINVERVGAKFLGIPMPKLISPAVAGVVRPGPDDCSWRVEVVISHPWLGVLCHYHGIMKAE